MFGFRWPFFHLIVFNFIRVTLPGNLCITFEINKTIKLKFKLSTIFMENTK